jgi:Protein of unknown function (DUF1573)
VRLILVIDNNFIFDMPLAIIFTLFHFFVAADSKLVWITPTTHDFGEIAKRQPVKHVFEFRNTGNEPLVIENVRAECGCTASDWEQEPVLSAQTGKITVTYDAAKSGTFYKKLTVWIKGQRKPEKLIVEGEVME